jgi:UDP-N-acetylglucosamine--N-acetylmuramyl-(pentapeptide) pyrophosphoryl-undecaprenol N-acetylglucosamine transferase
MPALALAEALTDVDPSVEPVLVGAKRGVEVSILPSRPYRHHLLSLQPMYRREWWKNWRWPLVALQTRRECMQVLDDERPVLALGTGGYASGPMLYWAHRRGLPIAIQEQNAFPGLTSRWLARKADKVFLGFPEARSYLRPGLDTVVHDFGNPITPPPEPRPDPMVLRAAMEIPAGLPIVLVVGGSQGARSINEVVAELVGSGTLENVALLWSTGQRTWETYTHFNAPPKRFVKAFWDPIADAYAVADLVVARAGAMTTAELCAWGLPSILVPLPGSAADHQRKNAAALAEAGAAIHLSETEMSPERLQSTIINLLGDEAALARIKGAAAARGRPEAARKIAAEVLRLVS